MKRIILLRHAKTERGHAELDDHERALTERGVGDAKRLGAWLRAQAMDVDAVQCSTAARARQTAELLHESWPTMPEPQYHRKLYLAAPGEMFALFQDQEDTFSSVMVIGHNPGLHQLCAGLAAQDDPRLDEVLLNFPTAALAVLEMPTSCWHALTPGTGRIAEFTYPTLLKAEGG